MADAPRRDVRVTVRVQPGTFDPGAEAAALERAAGAVATFTGLVRSEDGRLAALELEHYPGMAEAALQRVAQEAAARWPLTALTLVHRHGRLAVGERIVFVGAASRHRDAAFDAARFVMDYLKTDAPFWKKEHPADGSDGGWVDAKGADDKARAKWNGG